MMENLPNVYLEGDPVHLRPLQEADLDQCWRWLNRPEVRRSLLQARLPLDEWQEKKWWENRDRKNNVLLGICIDGDRYIGNCGLHQIDWVHRHAEFGIFIGESEEWGKGYGSEACRMICRYGFQELNLARIHLHVAAFNQRGIRAYEKVGFQKEGVLRDHLFVEGKRCDLWVMGLLAHENHSCGN